MTDLKDIEPVAWKGYDLNGMVEAFSRVIEAHANADSPFHNPINKDAVIALRIFRGFIPDMKRYTAPPTVSAAVAAALMKAAEVCKEENYGFDREIRGKHKHQTPEDCAKAILALPHDTTELREFGLRVLHKSGTLCNLEERNAIVDEIIGGGE